MLQSFSLRGSLSMIPLTLPSTVTFVPLKQLNWNEHG